MADTLSAYLVWTYCEIAIIIIGGFGGTIADTSPFGLSIFYFKQFFMEYWPNNRLTPFRVGSPIQEILDPPLKIMAIWIPIGQIYFHIKHCIYTSLTASFSWFQNDHLTKNLYILTSIFAISLPNVKHLADFIENLPLTTIVRLLLNPVQTERKHQHWMGLTPRSMKSFQALTLTMPQSLGVSRNLPCGTGDVDDNDGALEVVVEYVGPISIVVM